jgi:hypothetical protein
MNSVVDYLRPRSTHLPWGTPSAAGRDRSTPPIPTRQMAVLLTDYAVVGRIIDHLKLTFVAEKPPPTHLAYQEVLMAAEASIEYSS